MGSHHAIQLVRPPNFRLNVNAPIWRGLAAFYGGAFPGTTKMHDSSLYRNHGTLTGYTGAGNTPVDMWGRAMGRASLRLDGTADYVTCPSPSMPSGSPVTIAMWIARPSGAAAKRIASKTSCFLLSWWSDSKFYFALPGDDATRAVSSAYNVNSWLHLAFTNNLTQSLIYANGVLIGSANNTTGWTSNTNAIIWGGLAGAYFLGSIADPCIWSRALSTSEIAILADPSSVMLRMGGVPGLLDPVAEIFRCYPVTAGGGPAATPIPVFMNQYRQRSA